MIVNKMSKTFFHETRMVHEKFFLTLTKNGYPSQDSSVGSISAWYWGGPGFKSLQGQKFINENK